MDARPLAGSVARLARAAVSDNATVVGIVTCRNETAGVGEVIESEVMDSMLGGLDCDAEGTCNDGREADAAGAEARGIEVIASTIGEVVRDDTRDADGNPTVLRPLTTGDDVVAIDGILESDAGSPIDAIEDAVGTPMIENGTRGRILSAR